MMSIEDALKLTDPAAIEAEIDSRRELIGRMVGSLYPAILQSEVDKLTSRLEGLNHASAKGRPEPQEP